MPVSASPAPAAVMPGEAVIEGEEADFPDTEISALQPAGATALDDTSATAGQGSTEIKVEAVETPPVPNYDYPIGGAGYRRRPISEGSNCAECCCCCTTVGRFIICGPIHLTVFEPKEKPPRIPMDLIIAVTLSCGRSLTFRLYGGQHPIC